mmetsp:Transcript_12188/g.32897  ORF Transcript_12188/g.32897 Transcript_12188/m.32897 type:complete len:222 (+) Transcript_12188:485-1150(+)
MIFASQVQVGGNSMMAPLFCTWHQARPSGGWFMLGKNSTNWTSRNSTRNSSIGFIGDMPGCKGGGGWQSFCSRMVTGGTFNTNLSGPAFSNLGWSSGVALTNTRRVGPSCMPPAPHPTPPHPGPQLLGGPAQPGPPPQDCPCIDGGPPPPKPPPPQPPPIGGPPPPKPPPIGGPPPPKHPPPWPPQPGPPLPPQPQPPCPPQPGPPKPCGGPPPPPKPPQP